MYEPFFIRYQGDPNPGPSKHLLKLHDLALSISLTVNEMLDNGKIVEDILNQFDELDGESFISYHFVMYDIKRMLTEWGEGKIKVEVDEDDGFIKAKHLKTGGTFVMRIVR